MRLDSVRSLKVDLFESMIAPLAWSSVMRSAGLRAQPTADLAATPPTFALGVAPAGKGDFALAVRVQKRALEEGPHVEAIRKKAKGEVDVRYIGLAVKRAAIPWQQKTTRPLRVGASIGHYKITAGTLGCFVRERSDGSPRILSNNHVLANENRARKGDPILQPGAFDGGRNPEDKVGEYLRSVRLQRSRPNLVDAALASIDADIEFNARALTGIGKLAGLGDPLLDDGGEVRKIGRTTGKTTGVVTAFELDGVLVRFDIGVLSFDNQLEIEGVGDKPFSLGGDSGSLIVDSGRRGVGLLFAGSDLGGTNGKGLTFANPLPAVLDALKVDLDLA